MAKTLLLLSSQQHIIQLTSGVLQLPLISKGRFTEEFKIETVKQVEEHGHPLAETVARQGVSTHSTHTWLKRYNKSGEQRQQDNVEAAEIKCLKTEATQLREERDA